MFGDFSDQCGDILFDVLIRVLQTRQYGREDFCLNNHLSQVNRVFGNLTQGRENLALRSEKKKIKLTWHNLYSKYNFLKCNNLQIYFQLNLEYYTEYSENFIYLHFFLKLFKNKMNKYRYIMHEAKF